MKWLHYFILFLAVLSGAFFGSSILTENASAVSDYSGTLDYQHVSAIGVCNTAHPSDTLSGNRCSDYKYLLFSISGDFSNDSSAYVQYQSTNFKFLNLADPTVILISENVSLFLGNINSINNSNWTLHYTLTDSYPSDCPASPSGSITLNQNGTFDVSSYAQAVVDVPPVIEQGDYHDDLVSINQSILIVSASAFVLYFFFCVYRMYFKDIGVN